MRFEFKESPSLLRHLKVRCVLGFRHVTKRAKFIGKNAKKDVHGDLSFENVIRIYTDEGLCGTGFGNISIERAHEIIGRSVGELWEDHPDSSLGLGRADHALFDITGKAIGKPAWQFMGGAGPSRVPVYDTSIYFSDLLPQYLGCGVRRLIEELEDGIERGHRAFKIKVGRGARWMPLEEGLARDIEIVRTLSDFAGPGIRLMADANNQFGSDTARRFLDAVGDRLFFVEELFPEDANTYLEIRDWMSRRGLVTKLADGETEHDPQVLAHLARVGALDILQPDIRALGLRLQCALSTEISGLPEVTIAAHNWGSYLGTFKMLQLGRGIGNFLFAELDETRSDLFDDSEWELSEGTMGVPNTPGCGLRVREEVFRARYLPAAWLVGDSSAPLTVAFEP
jgi:L-alanine-DL-glutamate epimerase-like enolase superfamily enzyme